MQIPRFCFIKNDDDYNSNNKALMPMQDDDDLYIKAINSDDETDSNVGRFLTIILMMTVQIVHYMMSHQ